MTATAPCAARPSTCGTPAGWRAGGRCHACRKAHNLDTYRRRGLGPLTREQRATALQLLGAGHQSADVASQLGRSERSLNHQATTDAELRAALAGAPKADQYLARLGDFFAALTRHRGNATEAAREIGAEDQYVHWKGDAQIKNAIDAIRDMAGRPRRPRRRAPGALIDRAADAIENGVSVAEAARQVGLPVATLYAARRSHPRLAATGKVGPRPSKRSDATDAQLTTLWNEGLPLRVIAEKLDISVNSVSRWRRHLGLPSRRTRVSAAARVDVSRLAQLWDNRDYTTSEIARTLGISVPELYMLREVHGLPYRRDARKQASG